MFAAALAFSLGKSLEDIRHGLRTFDSTYFQAPGRMNVFEEHPFRVIKRQFGLIKVRFRGLAKNTAHVITLFALSNLWMARRQLMTMMGAVRPKAA
jgi:IS5 family transposase